MNKLTRRDFVKTTAMSAAAIAAYKASIRSAYAFGYSMPLQKFIQPMPMFGARALHYDPAIPDIPLARLAEEQRYLNVDYYQLTAGVFRERLHPQLPITGTQLYGYRDHTGVGSHKHLGGAVVATKDRPVRFTFASDLPRTHILPYDTSIPSPGDGGDRQDRAAVHLHGGLVPWPSDGGPFHWQSNPANANGLEFGASVIPWLWDGTLNGGVPDTTKKVWDYFYPNHQSERLMWYHDHAVGQTRLNAYAGVATGYIITGPDGPALRLPFGDPIVFQDKVFWNPASDPSYSLHVTGALAGDLWYPWQYDPKIWPIAQGGVPPSPSAVPEFFGDTMLTNGVVYPYHQVGVGRYRFRLLNACNARFLDLSFVVEDPAIPGEPLLAKPKDKPKIKVNNAPVLANVDVWQIGTEGGFLPGMPVPLVSNGVQVQPFILGPGERADIIVDFKAAGNVILYNVAGSPFPGGAPIFDWYYGANNTAVKTTANFGPNTRTIMQFRVGSVAPPEPFPIPATLPGITIPTVTDGVNGGLKVDEDAFAAQFPTYTIDPDVLNVTLNEVVEPATFTTSGNTGRLLTLIGNQATTALTHPPFGPAGILYTEAPTERVVYNTLRIWKVYNFTADAHPMHFHLFNVQVLGRQNVDPTGIPLGLAVPPLPNEMGLKETVTMYPGQVTIVAALVEDPMPAALYQPDATTGRPTVRVTLAADQTKSVDSPVPPSPRLANEYDLTNHDEYVWHCHILEHEEHDMMRPLVASS